MAAGRAAFPSVVIMDGQSLKTTERGGPRGFDGYQRVKGRQRHILVDTLGLRMAHRVEPANMSDRGAGARLLGGVLSVKVRNTGLNGPGAAENVNESLHQPVSPG